MGFPRNRGGITGFYLAHGLCFKNCFFFLVKIILISKLVMSLQIIQMLLYPVGFQTFLFKYSIACIEVISNTRILTVEKIIASYMILICS